MARRDDYDERSVWVRPVFLVSAVLIVAVLVLGVWLAVANERRDDGGGQGTAAQADGSGTGADDADRGSAAGPTGGTGAGGTADPDEPGGADDAAPDDASPAPDRGDPTGAPSAPPAAPAAGEPSWCGLGPAVPEGTVTRAPEGVVWELVGTVAAPTLPGTGPGVKDTDGFRACYAQSPTGALLAAANVVAMGSLDTLVARTTAELTAAGPGREAALARLAEEEAATVDGATTDGTTVDGTAAEPATTAPPPTPALPSAVARYQIRGFHMIGYTGDTASVDIALGLDNGALGSFVVDLVWEGDWKVRLTDVGTLPTPPAQIPNLAGYTVWSGA